MPNSDSNSSIFTILRYFLTSISQVEKGLNRLRRILQTSDMPGSDTLRLTLSLTLGKLTAQEIGSLIS